MEENDCVACDILDKEQSSSPWRVFIRTTTRLMQRHIINRLQTLRLPLWPQGHLHRSSRATFALVRMSDPFAEGKKFACIQAVDENVSDGMKVGIGSGSTIVFAVNHLKERVAKEKLNLICVPTSFQARELILQAGLVIGDLNEHPELDVAIDGADEVDDKLNCIKGGGACHLIEKLVASAAKRFVIVADDRKNQKVLGSTWKQGVPLEVSPSAYRLVMRKVTSMGGQPVLRMCTGGKAGPVVTDSGNFVIDADFGQIKDPASLNSSLLQIAGIIETGLFIGMANKCYFGTNNGKVVTTSRS